jgi:hypothetical protein
MKRNIQALVIGNGAYPGKLKLECPKNDAQAVGDSLRNLGANVLILQDATFGELITIVESFIDKANLPETNVSLLYYSGHGIQLLPPRGPNDPGHLDLSPQNFLVPVDFERDADPNIANLISVQSILDQMTNATSIRIVTLDACRDSGDARRSVVGKSISTERRFFINDQPLPPAGLAEMGDQPDTFIAFAAPPGQVAREGLPGEKLSPFTQSLVNYLEVVDLPLSNLTSRVRQEVLENTGGLQRTWDQSSLMSPFYFNPGSLWLFAGTLLSVVGLVFSVLILALVSSTPNIAAGWIIIASGVALISLFVLLYSVQSVYARPRGKTGWQRERRPLIKIHLVHCLRRGLIGGYNGALIAAVPLGAPYYTSWIAQCRAASTGLAEVCYSGSPTASFGQLLLEIAIATALTACTLGFFSTFFAWVSTVGREWESSRSPRLRAICGAIAGGAVTGFVAAPLVTLYFGSHMRPEFLPNFLMPGAVLGAAFIIFSIINFDFERLNTRRLWASAASSIVAVLAGIGAALLVFIPLYVSRLVNVIRFWLEINANDPTIVLVGGVAYGIPVGIVLGLVIGIALVLTEKWSKKPVLV